MTSGLTSFFLLAALIVVAGCDTHHQQDEFAEQASRPPSGITRTDEGGGEDTVDEDDWRTAPVYAGEITVDPAFPNPVESGGFITVPITVTAFNAIRAPLYIETLSDDRLIRLDQLDQAADPGAYIFNFSAGRFITRGLHRVYIFDGVGEIVSYGDIMIQ